MELSIIALIVSVVCLTANVVIYKQTKKRRNKSDKDFFYSSSNEVSLRSVDREVSRLSEEVQPLIDKHKEEQKQKLIETRKAHWKSFNTWKFHKGMFEEEFEKDKDNTVCGECLSDGLKLNVDYKTSLTIDRFGLGGRVENDYPISAELKCTVCNHVSYRWEYKE